ncbi:MAG TPA: hypothetical protein VJ201_04860, partial [Candidatus Babeliales bacterium]|nr:hypothetical protein [Candidatus Babeliales bacterium]
SKYFDIYIDYGKTDKIKKIKDTVGYFPSISCQWHDEMAETYNGSMDHPFKPSVIKKTINLVAKYNKSKNAVILSET